MEDSAGNWQVRYVVAWSDGTVEQYASKKELPREARLFVSGYVAAPARSCPSWFGLAWLHEPDQLTITWPTFHWMTFVLALGTLGLIPTTGWTIWYWNAQKPMSWMPYALSASVLAIILTLALNRFVRSRLQFGRDSVCLWTNYGCLVRREEWPRRDVLEAIVAIIPIFPGERRRARVSFQIRIRTGSGIEWRRIGGHFMKWKALALPSELRRFVKVRTESG